MRIQVKNEYITLGQLLKVTDFISTGGEAKSALSYLHVLVNGEKENRRGRKLYPNDKVIIEDKSFELE